MNNSDPPTSLPNDQGTLAQNVEFVVSMLGERRRGSDDIDLTGSDLVTCDRIVWVHRHLPTTNEADAQLWALGITDGAPSTATLAYKDTTWHTVVMADALTIDGVSEYQVQGASLHGKLFIAYNSSVDRLHVWDGSLRRAGLAEPAAAPTGANSGSGTFTGTRYYRTRETVQVSGTTILRSEPSAALTFAPSGTGSGATITKPTTANSNATHWEHEASVDNANFYRIATVAIGTSTSIDTTAFTPGYASNSAFTLSEDIGDYTLIGSVRFLAVDDDRLVWASSNEDAALTSRVGWTPVAKSPGVGNDERYELDTDPFVDLDGLAGGALTGISTGVHGYIYSFKYGHAYYGVRSGQRSKAYTFYNITTERGAVEGSMVPGVDQAGNPALYVLDPSVGPYYIAKNGLQTCGADIRATWDTVNLDGASVVARSLFYPEPKQVHWWIATDDADTPNLRLVLQTNEMRITDDGMRKGWALWPGPSSAAIAVCMFAENIDDDSARSRVLRPFIALEGNGLIWRTDTGDDDNGTEYVAHVVSKPFVQGNILNEFEVMSGALIATATEDAVIDVTVTRDFGLETKTVTGVTLDPEGAETQVIKLLSDLRFAELRAAQVEFKDPAIPGARWEINLFALKESKGQGA